MTRWDQKGRGWKGRKWVSNCRVAGTKGNKMLGKERVYHWATLDHGTSCPCVLQQPRDLALPSCPALGKHSVIAQEATMCIGWFSPFYRRIQQNKVVQPKSLKNPSNTEVIVSREVHLLSVLAPLLSVTDLNADLNGVPVAFDQRFWGNLVLNFL